MKHFEIWMADLSSVQSGHMEREERPVVIISADDASAELPFVSVIPMTTNLTSRQRLSHVLLSSPVLGQPHRALCEQVTTLDKACMHHRIGYVEDPYDRFAINRALSVALNLPQTTYICEKEISFYETW